MKIAQRVSSAIAVCLLSIILFFVGSFKAFAYTTIGAEIPVNCLGVSDDNTHIYTIKLKLNPKTIIPLHQIQIRLKSLKTGRGVLK